MKTLATLLTLACAAATAGAQTVVVPAPAPSTVVVPAVPPAATPPPVVVPAPVPGGVAIAAPPGAVVANGVVDVYEPGARFVVRETTGPVAYTYGPDVVYATPGGVVLTAEQVRTRMRAGLPVRVEYINQGDTRVVRRVVIEEPVRVRIGDDD